MAVKYGMMKRAKKMAAGGPVCEACRGGECMEHGGMVEDDGGDIVDRIMKKRYSKGGVVANETEVVADFEPNEFDELVKDGGEDFSYTGANSGDEIGNAQENEDREDIVSKIMRSRAKKDRMPRPA